MNGGGLSVHWIVWSIFCKLSAILSLYLSPQYHGEANTCFSRPSLEKSDNNMMLFLYDYSNGTSIYQCITQLGASSKMYPMRHLVVPVTLRYKDEKSHIPLNLPAPNNPSDMIHMIHQFMSLKASLMVLDDCTV